MPIEMTNERQLDDIIDKTKNPSKNVVKASKFSKKAQISRKLAASSSTSSSSKSLPIRRLFKKMKMKPKRKFTPRQKQVHLPFDFVGNSLKNQAIKEFFLSILEAKVQAQHGSLFEQKDGKTLRKSF